jgi:glyoxylase-like metal-dependent hydrolase (beta-lactamase superfamily II)
MAEVKVLIEGYTSKDTGGRSCSTIVLVKDGGLAIVADPGTSESQDAIRDALADEGLSPEEVGIVFITHAHMDHYRNAGMFPNAKALDYWGLWEGDMWTKCDGRVTDDVTMIKTPGHSYDGVTLLVKTEEGTIAICGDVFWKESWPQKDKYATDGNALAKSRKLVMQSADFVIPGHGKAFATGRGRTQGL